MKKSIYKSHDELPLMLNIKQQGLGQTQWSGFAGAEHSLIVTERTDVITRDGLKRNGCLLYIILPILAAMDHYYQQQLLRMEKQRQLQQMQNRLGQQRSNPPPDNLEATVCPPWD